MLDNYPPAPATSPCIDVCELDADDVCIGCGRSLDEIGDWSTASEQEKTQIIARAQDRIRQRSQTG